MAHNSQTFSGDVPAVHEDGERVLDIIPDDHQSCPAHRIQKADFMNCLNQWLSTLPEKEWEIVSRRFGLEDNEAVTLEELGAIVGLTRERVRQIQIQALEKLKKRLTSEGLGIELLAEDD